MNGAGPAPAPAVLLVQLQPPPELVSEFHDWYDTEHIPERARIPGFLSTVRLVCASGWPGYAGFYDLEHAGILEEEPYRAITGDNTSAWSRRVLGRVVGYDRLLLEQVSKGGHALRPASRGVAVLRFGGESAEQWAVRGARVLARGMVGGQARVFRRLGSSAPETVVIADAPALDLIAPWSPAELSDAFGELAADIRGIWRYTRYWRQGA
jgi:hypothetical protein